MAVGRKRVPDHLKVVAGTAQPCRMNPDPPMPSADVPVAPEWLSERAAAIFAEMVGVIRPMGIASASDTAALALLALRLEEVEICSAIIDAESRTYTADTGQIKGHPAVAQRSEAMRHAQSLLSEFGLSPAARSKVSATKAPEANPFKALME